METGLAWFFALLALEVLVEWLEPGGEKEESFGVVVAPETDFQLVAVLMGWTHFLSQ